jgi:ankyrin repeat protein
MLRARAAPSRPSLRCSRRSGARRRAKRAARRGQGDDTARALTAIDEGADVRQRAADGTTALHYAVYHDNVPLIERLIAKGADADSRQ